jgi:hypothetical protein
LENEVLGLELVLCYPRYGMSGLLDRSYKACSGPFNKNDACERCFQVDTLTWSPQDDIDRADSKQRLAGGDLRKPLDGRQ